MSNEVPAPNRPFRWRLVRPDQLGALLDGIGEPWLRGLVTELRHISS